MSGFVARRRSGLPEVAKLLAVDIALPEVEELQKLVTDGHEKGFLSYDEIVKGLEDVELTKEQVEDFYTHLIERGIDLVEGEQHKTPPHEQPQPEDEKVPAIPKLDLMVEKLNKVVHIERQLVQRLGREPNAEEIADELEMTPEEVREILRMAQLPVSLEKPIGEEEDSSLGDFVQDEAAESPFDTAQLSLRREDIEMALGALPVRERQVIELRFGLQGGPPRTLEEVGRAFGVTRERIRQIENNTLKKLEHLPEAQALRDAVS